MPNDSILNSVKKVLGLAPEYDAFDQDVIMHINSVFSTLQQNGVGPEDGFQITGSDELWSTYIGDQKLLNSVRSYMALKVRLQFDPPATSNAVTSMENICKEYEWRLYIASDPIVK